MGVRIDGGDDTDFYTFTNIYLFLCKSKVADTWYLPLQNGFRGWRIPFRSWAFDIVQKQGFCCGGNGRKECFAQFSWTAKAVALLSATALGFYAVFLCSFFVPQWFLIQCLHILMTEPLKHPKEVYIAFCPTFSLYSQFIILHNYSLLNRWKSSPSFISSSASQYINGGGRILKVVLICNNRSKNFKICLQFMIQVFYLLFL